MRGFRSRVDYSTSQGRFGKTLKLAKCLGHCNDSKSIVGFCKCNVSPLKTKYLLATVQITNRLRWALNSILLDDEWVKGDFKWVSNQMIDCDKKAFERPTLADLSSFRMSQLGVADKSPGSFPGQCDTFQWISNHGGSIQNFSFYCVVKCLNEWTANFRLRP